MSEFEDVSEDTSDVTPKLESPDNALDALGVKLVQQDSIERKVAQRADQAILSKEAELEEKRLQKTTDKYDNVMKRISLLESKITNPRTKISEKESLRKDIKWIRQNELLPLEQDLKDIRARILERATTVSESSSNVVQAEDSSNAQLPSETRQEFLIRTGKITAFGTSNGFEQDNDTGYARKDEHTHQQLRAPGLQNLLSDGEDDGSAAPPDADNDSENSDYDVDLNFLSLEEEITKDEEEEMDLSDEVKDLAESRSRIITDKKSKTDELRNIDDGEEAFYQKRYKEWASKRSKLRHNYHPDLVEDDDQPEYLKRHPTEADAVLNSQFKIPGDIYPSLFDYQKTGVQWLWELYSQKTGGIIGDEMGLGKTIQLISFLAGLHYSGLLEKPILIVCPATVLKQWTNEFHTWWPPFRTIILHSIGSGMNAKNAEKDELYYDQLLEMEDLDEKKLSTALMQSQLNAKNIIDRVFEKGHVLITTYVGLRIYSKHLLHRKWGYVVLDEGHKIRNPNSDISLTCKQLKTPNRIILSGTPIQNNLIELWSLFDFIFPGRLGTLPVFEQQFSIPINIGGYANATNVQVQTGYKCAVVLRDLISPYLLRRVKADVAKDLPEKNEMVLFCKLTKYQLNLYQKFLKSEDMESVLNGRRNVLFGVDFLRKICNHPDLVQPQIRKTSDQYGDYKKSGKMQVVKALVELWFKEGNKMLIFTQTKQMLDILEKFVKSNPQYNYLRMDGSTPIKFRQELVDLFNNDPKYNIFLLTTRVGGLGVNLTGANRVIIYDPDWNPSTDVQARERAWRLGQKKDVTIYRLMIASSIEEKIYHRQIFKQFLTNKILKDPKQRRFFKMNDLHDLFSLGDQDEKGTETGDMFSGTEINFGGSSQRRTKKLNKSIDEAENPDYDDLNQVASIEGVAKLQEFQGDAKQKNESGESSELMEGLFANHGVHSALQHDSIMEGSRPEVVLVDREATKVAEEAARKLRESRRAVRRSRIGTPTYTGRFGSAGRVSKLGPSKSSSSILQNIRAKKELENLKTGRSGASLMSMSRSASPAVRSSAPSSSRSSPETTEISKVEDTTLLMEKIRDFISKKESATATSSEVVTHLGLRFSSQRDIQFVRSILRSICDWDAEGKNWKLKEDFKD